MAENLALPAGFKVVNQQQNQQPQLPAGFKVVSQPTTKSQLGNLETPTNEQLANSGLTPLPEMPQFQGGEEVQPQQEPSMLQKVGNAIYDASGQLMNAGEKFNRGIAELSGGLQRGAIGMTDIPIHAYNMVAPYAGLPQSQTNEEMIRQATGGNIAPEKGAFLGDTPATNIIAPIGEFASAGGVGSKAFSTAAQAMKQGSTGRAVADTLAGAGVASETGLGALSGAGAGALGEGAAQVGGEFFRPVGEFVGAFAAPVTFASRQNKAYDNDLLKALLDGDVDKVARLGDFDPKYLKLLDENELTALAPLAAASRNQQFQSIEGAASALPNSEAQSVKIGFHNALREKSKQNIERMSGFENPIEASDFYTNNEKDVIEGLRSEAGSYFNKSKNLIPKNDRMPLQNTENILREEFRNLEGSEGLVDSDFMKAYKSLIPAESNQARYNSLMNQSSTDKKMPTYYAVDTLRRQIGKQVSKSIDKPFKNLDDALANKLYAALSEDQKAFVGNKYPEYLPDLEKGNALWTQAKQAEENAIDVLGKKFTKPITQRFETAISALSKGKMGTIGFDDLMGKVNPQMRVPIMAVALGEHMTKKAKFMKDYSANAQASLLEYLKKNKPAREKIFEGFTDDQKKTTMGIMELSDGLDAIQNQTVKTGASRDLRSQLDDRRSPLDKFFERFAAPIAQYGASKIGAPTLGTNIANVIRGQTDNMTLLQKTLGDPVFRLKVLDAARTRAEGKPVKDGMLTKSMQDYVNSLPVELQQRVSGIGLLNYLTGDE